MHRSLWMLGLWLLAGAPASAREFTVCVWNLQNFGVTDRFVQNRPVKAAMKPEKEIHSAMAILRRIDPDIVGFSEIIQAPEDAYVNLLRARLKKAGLDYPYFSTVRGEDPRIQCAVFSRFPILKEEPLHTETFKATLKSKSTGEKTEVRMRVCRGFINTVFEVEPGYPLRIVQAHLKSRRAAEEVVSDQPNEPGDAYIRRNEAVILKNALNRILEKNPGEKLLAMGDFNDVPRSKAVKTILGSKGAKVRMYDLWLRDWLGDWWTHYYIPDNQYERIDYMVASAPLFRDWVASKSYVYRQKPEDGPEYNTYLPSDHRPLVAVFDTQKKSATGPKDTASEFPPPDSED
jgi:endonuclease/exonuclease/phosphatase family metal-dependent hydrolase